MYKTLHPKQVGIFIPVYFREELVIKSLDSLLTSNFDPSLVQVFVAIGINGANKSFRDYLKNYLLKYSKAHNGSKYTYIDVFDPGVNFGKPKIINAMAKKNDKFDFLVSMDSDIQITDSDWLLKLIDAYYVYMNTVDIDREHKSLGALCSNQEGHCVHQAETLGKISLKLKDYTFVSTPTNTGVAGGVLMTPKYVWERLGGYVASNIYGSDDGAYAIQCDKLDYLMAYIDEIKCFHPEEINIKYAEWKLRACSGELKDDEKRGFFEKLRNGNIQV